MVDVLQLFVNPPAPMVVDDISHSNTEKRFIAVGQTPEERYIFIGFTLREKDGETLIRPITARYMHQREVERYEQR